MIGREGARASRVSRESRERDTLGDVAGNFSIHPIKSMPTFPKSTKSIPMAPYRFFQTKKISLFGKKMAVMIV